MKLEPGNVLFRGYQTSFIFDTEKSSRRFFFALPLLLPVIPTESPWARQQTERYPCWPQQIARRSRPGKSGNAAHPSSLRTFLPALLHLRTVCSPAYFQHLTIKQSSEKTPKPCSVSQNIRQISVSSVCQAWNSPSLCAMVSATIKQHPKSMSCP